MLIEQGNDSCNEGCYSCVGTVCEALKKVCANRIMSENVIFSSLGKSSHAFLRGGVVSSAPPFALSLSFFGLRFFSTCTVPGCVDSTFVAGAAGVSRNEFLFRADSPGLMDRQTGTVLAFSRFL